MARIFSTTLYGNTPGREFAFNQETNFGISLFAMVWGSIWTKIHGKPGTLGFRKLKIHGTVFESVKETMSYVRAC
jgi:hypothetical protein